ncbi:MAG: hypothetical protein KAG96_03215 [Ichthyobacteriaceae bacterium]|nr:hypothetical protein [Ichthyobacteriaceae bacterium]
MKKYLLLIILLNVFTQTIFAQTRVEYKQLDAFVENTPNNVEESIESLAKYLGLKAKSDIEKTRAIYVWIAKNISYDDYGYNNSDLRDYSFYDAENVLKNRVAVCEGFSNLFVALGLEMDLEVKKVVGYSKGIGFMPNNYVQESDHAWNVVKIDDEWKIFDATWGEGNGEIVRGKLVSTKQFDELWFDIDPYSAIFSHLPEVLEYANIKEQLTVNKYYNLQNVDYGFFKLGFDSEKTFKKALNNSELQFVESYDFAFEAKVVKAPFEKILRNNKKYKFQLYIPKAKQVAIIDSKGNFTELKKNKKSVFYLNYIPKNIDAFEIGVNLKGNRYSTILKYKVKR